jgi:hypothetical protein
MSKLVRKTLADSPLTPARKRKLAELAAGFRNRFFGNPAAKKELLGKRRPQSVL